MYFLPHIEKNVADELRKLFKRGIQITKPIVRSTAREFYYCHRILAEKATFQFFIDKKMMIFDVQQQYSIELIQFSDKLRNEIEENISEEDNSYCDDVIRKYNLPQTIFGETWGRNFYQSNKLTWRLPHFSRRVNVDPTYVSAYINQLTRAVNTFGWDFIFNMDETSVRINNSSKRTLAPIGTEDVEIDCQRNYKECFSMIATISRGRTYKPIFLYKGVDAKNARAKFNFGKDIDV